MHVSSISTDLELAVGSCTLIEYFYDYASVNKGWADKNGLF